MTGLWLPPDTVIERTPARRPRFSLLEEMFIERGTRADWELLHDLHYKAGSLPIGPRFWKLTLAGETIGVLVSSVPKGMVKERHLVLPNLKPRGTDTKIVNTQRYVWINANLRVVSRFVLDTMYRGVGAGYRMMNLVSRMENRSFMEIQSSMSKFNMFGQKAGFRFAQPTNANNFEAGLRFFRGNFAANPQDFEALIEEVESKPPAERDALIETCRTFYYKKSALEQTGNNRDGRGKNRVESMDIRTIIKAIQQVSLASPMYGIWRNPDVGRTLPERLPLIAFDRQGPNQPLVLP